MAVDRTLWTQPIIGEHWPDWHCPSCTGGYLRVKPNSFHFHEGALSRQSHNEEAFEPGWVEWRFTALLVCNNERCQEGIAVSGKGTVDQFTREDEADWDYVNVYHPQYVNPSPRLITLPEDCPQPVGDALRRAMIAQWSDASAAANHIRKAVEALLDELKQPRYSISKKRTRHRLPLHERIVGLASRDLELSNALLAVKWIGNEGSHRDELTRDDVFDALDLIEDVLKTLFDDHKTRLNRLVRQINRRKGPQRRSRRGHR
jgi:hypothetical protein